MDLGILLGTTVAYVSFVSLLSIIALVLNIGLGLFWLVMLIDVIRREETDFPNQSKDEKLVWILVITMANIVGAIVYYFVVYRKEMV